MKRKLFHEPIISFFIVYLYYIQLGRLDFYYWMDGKDSFSFFVEYLGTGLFCIMSSNLNVSG